MGGRPGSGTSASVEGVTPRDFHPPRSVPPLIRAGCGVVAAANRRGAGAVVSLRADPIRPRRSTGSTARRLAARPLPDQSRLRLPHGSFGPLSPAQLSSLRKLRERFLPDHEKIASTTPTTPVDSQGGSTGATRATVLGSVERAERNRELALLVVSPDVQDVPLRDFRSLDRAIEAGRSAARAALDEGGRDALLTAVSAPVAHGWPVERRSRLSP